MVHLPIFFNKTNRNKIGRSIKTIQIEFCKKMKTPRQLFLCLLLLAFSMNVFAQTYIITGSGTSFTATRNSATIGSAGQPIQTVIDGIRTHAAGAACAIQFGNGIETLNIGSARIFFRGSWGLITMSGKITGTTTVQP